MRYHALAADYDGTLAHHGKVNDETIAALVKLRESGRRLIMVTGRELPDLMNQFDRLDLFHRVVAENGALLYTPETKEQKVLGEQPPYEFVRALERRGVARISVGRVIVATWEPHEKTVLEVIRDQGREMQVIFNKGAVMILPSGVNKATGLAVALEQLGLSHHNVVGVGDAENDHAFLSVCECAVAVANALPAVRERADLVTRGDHGDGIIELVSGILQDDLAGVASRLGRHSVLIGKTLGQPAEQEERLDMYGSNVLVTGTSGSGKSTLTTGLLERIAELGYQFVVIDPEGDYSTLEAAVVLGDPKRAPLVEEVIDVLKAPARNAVVNMLGIALEHRPTFFAELLPRLIEKRNRTGRPHWIIVDEAHHLLPVTWTPGPAGLPRKMHGVLFITVHPESVSPDVVQGVDIALAVGRTPAAALGNFCRAVGEAPCEVDPADLGSWEAVVWRKGDGKTRKIVTQPPKTERKRHSRKYAEGALSPERSFVFRGPEGKLKLRAQNLMIFLQMADGVDDETWNFHLRGGHYSGWFQACIKDDELAKEARAVEEQPALAPEESRRLIREAVEKRYTLPADRPSGIVDTSDA